MKNEKSFSNEKFLSSFNLNCPDDFNFAFDIVSNKYRRSKKTTFIAINKNRNDFEKIKHYFKNILVNFFLKNLLRTISGKISKVDLRNNLKE